MFHVAFSTQADLLKTLSVNKALIHSLPLYTTFVWILDVLFSFYHNMGRVETPPDLNGNRQASPLNNVIASTTLATAATILRLITRIWVVRQVGWDDYTIIAADLGHILGFILVFVELHYGFGWPGSTISPEYFREFERYSYAEWIQTFQTLMFTKSSICFFLLRIHINKEYIRPIQVTIVGLVVSNLILTFLWIFQCSPVEAAWDKRKLDAGLDGQNSGYCMTNGQLERIILSQALVSIISDFMLALFPVLLLWKVQISLRTKFGLWGLMALGLAYEPLSILNFIIPALHPHIRYFHAPLANSLP